MKVWEYTKKAETLLNQRSCFIYRYVLYTMFYTLLLKANIDNGLNVQGVCKGISFLHKIVHILFILTLCLCPIIKSALISQKYVHRNNKDLCSLGNQLDRARNSVACK